MGKGSFTRPTNKEAYDKNYQEAFGKQKPPTTWDPSQDPKCVTFLEEHRENEDEGESVYRCGICFTLVDDPEDIATCDSQYTARCEGCGRYFSPKETYVSLQEADPSPVDRWKKLRRELSALDKCAASLEETRCPDIETQARWQVPDTKEETPND